ncbi:MAG TPA: hypothetical protein VIK14_04990, partial [Ignavibacteria bacterium]
MKTKTFILIGFLFLVTESTYSQNIEESKNQIRIETGYAFTGSGDLNGFCFYNEYSQSVGNRFKIASGIGILTFFYDFLDNTSDHSILLMNANCISLDLTGYYYPVKTDHFDIETGLGFYIRDWHWIYATGPDISYRTRGLIISPDSHADIFVNAPGYTVSIGTILKINSRFGISIRGVYQNDTNG